MELEATMRRVASRHSREGGNPRPGPFARRFRFLTTDKPSVKGRRPQFNMATPHDAAVSIVARLISANLGGSLEAQAQCNQCPDRLMLNLVEGIASIKRESFVGTVKPDICGYAANGDPVRFYEVVDSHAPETNVHEYALAHGIEVMEIHLRTEREFTGKRRNKALDASLTAKVRLEELASGRIVVDAHNLGCQRPICKDCGHPLALRTITVSVTDCWKCGQNVLVATGTNDAKGLVPDEFTLEELQFAQGQGVKLERRFSATAGGKYLANICTACDQLQGNWFLYVDPLHDRFNLPTKHLETYGPCNPCSTYHCWSHEEYRDYKHTGQCPACLEEAQRVMCPNNPARECYYPNQCEGSGCYFLNREQQAQAELERQEQEQRQAREQREAQHQQEQQQLASFQECYNGNRTSLEPQQKTPTTSVDGDIPIEPRFPPGADNQTRQCNCGNMCRQGYKLCDDCYRKRLNRQPLR